MEKEDISFLNQLVTSLEEARLKLEESYNKKDHEKFNKSRKLVLELQKKISEILR